MLLFYFAMVDLNVIGGEFPTWHKRVAALPKYARVLPCYALLTPHNVCSWSNLHRTTREFADNGIESGSLAIRELSNAMISSFQLRRLQLCHSSRSRALVTNLHPRGRPGNLISDILSNISTGCLMERNPLPWIISRKIPTSVDMHFESHVSRDTPRDLPISCGRNSNDKERKINPPTYTIEGKCTLIRQLP